MAPIVCLISVYGQPLFRGVGIAVTENSLRARQQSSFLSVHVAKFIASVKLFFYSKSQPAAMEASNNNPELSESDESNSDSEPEGDIPLGNER